ncbi:hypothetical protein F4809DRAFT_660800 [Biscogniauxia mediterranea]|nr:hypothetical protein F4809DRAFT_660800 [Biscogniauxia mediterranea]
MSSLLVVSGRPHVVRDEPMLLGLSAWHIFPDMVVFNSGGSGSTVVKMKDALVKPGGVISLGISGYGGQKERGVYWSLSLAHHKFYGEAVSHTRRLDSDGSRMSLNELILRDWRSLLSRPIDAYLAGEKQAILAVSLGRRRPRFLPAELTKSPRFLFQLTHLPSLLFLLKEVNRKIELLRRLGSRIDGLDKDNSVILCFRTYGQDKSRTFASVFAKEPDRANMPEARK